MNEMGVAINLKVDKNLELARKMKAKKIWDKEKILPESKGVAEEVLLMDLSPEQVEKYQSIKRKKIAFYQLSRNIKTKSFCILAVLENRHIYDYLDEEMKCYVNGVWNKNSGLDYITL
jgi:hypothetical protein